MPLSALLLATQTSRSVSSLLCCFVALPLNGLFGVQVVLRKQDGYDHGYYFIATFMEDHIDMHAAALNA